METIPKYVSQVEQLSAQFQRSEQFLSELLSFSRNLETSLTSTSSLFPTLEHLVQPLLSSLPSINTQLAAIKGKLEEIEGKECSVEFDVETKQEIDWEFVQIEDSEKETSQELTIAPNVQTADHLKPKKASQPKAQKVGPYSKKLTDSAKTELPMRIEPIQEQHLIPPKNQAVLERLRARLEVYRERHRADQIAAAAKTAPKDFAWVGFKE